MHAKYFGKYFVANLLTLRLIGYIECLKLSETDGSAVSTKEIPGRQGN